MAWANDYRPDRFEDVLGQNDSVKQLSQLILRGRVVRNAFLHGPRGLGKTTLVPIYAKALNCSKLTELGSPCGECHRCQASSTYLFRYDVPKAPNKEEVQAWLKAMYRPDKDFVRTLFFDEAQAFKAGAMEVLLDPLEEQSPNISICIATSEPWKLNAAFKSRFTLDLVVQPLSLLESVVLLERVAKRQRLEYDRQALATIARLKRGYARDMVQALEQVSIYSKVITADAAKAVLDLEQGADLVSYLLALIKGDADACVAAKNSWRATPAEQIVLIRAFLLSMFYRDIMRQNISINSIMDEMIEGRDEIIAALKTRLGVETNEQLRPYFLSMVEFWFSATTDRDEGALNTQMLCFEELVQSLSVKMMAPVLPEIIENASEKQSSNIYPSHVSATAPTLKGYLARNDIRDIFNRSSFYVQHYGEHFNVWLTVLANRRSGTNDIETSSAFARFCAGLAELTDNKPPSAFIAIPECIDGNFRLNVIARFPNLDGAILRREIDVIAEKSNCNTAEFRFDAKAVKRAHQTQWSLVRELCAGFVDIGGDERGDLLENLKVPKNVRRTPNPIARPRPIFSTLLSDEAIQRECSAKMGFLSAFDAEEWEHIGGDWELEEYKDRRDEIDNRSLMLADIRALFEHEPDKLALEVARLQNGWPERPEQRQRRWVKNRWF